ncbi:Yip1 family protein [Neobacillus niacini]|uniref:Yip1 family protein n=1 Tax=Neobacillus niacini TaxID=86668 RepID=UPI0021CB6A78|nr:Yip1 family protein [Neobacillus niacini]MCM3767478.1 YIP1 family protein [Neobacillus niacini]
MEMQTEIKKEHPSLIGMFTSPGEQFERIKQNPKIWLPLTIICIIFGVGMALMALSMDVTTLIDQGIPEDQAELILGITRITVAVTGIVSPIISVLVSSAIYLLIAKIANSSVSFKQLFSLNTFIMFVGAIGLILNMAIRYGIGGNPEIYVTSLAGVLNLDKPGVLGSIEVFGIWTTVLTALGLHKTAGFSKGLAWTVAIIFFLITIGFALIGTALQSAPQL